jgi:pseudouridine synthase
VLGQSADPDTQKILVNHLPLPKKPGTVTIAVYKPRGVVTTKKDEAGRKTVTDLLPPNLKHLYPMGRLDMSSDGLLLMTNDGELTHAMTHPSFEVEKTYLCWIAPSPDDTPEVLDLAVERLRAPMDLPTGHYGSAQVIRRDFVFTITIHEGKNREIRYKFEAVGLHVTRLMRVKFGPIELGTLSKQPYRVLTSQEVAKMRASLGLDTK